MVHAQEIDFCERSGYRPDARGGSRDYGTLNQPHRPAELPSVKGMDPAGEGYADIARRRCVDGQGHRGKVSSVSWICRAYSATLSGDHM